MERTGVDASVKATPSDSFPASDDCESGTGPWVDWRSFPQLTEIIDSANKMPDVLRKGDWLIRLSLT